MGYTDVSRSDSCTKEGVGFPREPSTLIGGRLFLFINHYI